jgi:hypothetical protein
VIAQRGRLPVFENPPSETQLDPLTPTPQRLFDLGAATARMRSGGAFKKHFEEFKLRYLGTSLPDEWRLAEWLELLTSGAILLDPQLTFLEATRPTYYSLSPTMCSASALALIGYLASRPGLKILIRELAE